MIRIAIRTGIPIRARLNFRRKKIRVLIRSVIPRAANPAIHLFDVAFLRHIADDAVRLPWHLARKKVPHPRAAARKRAPAQKAPTAGKPSAPIEKKRARKAKSG